jgi:hypothetical protein
LRDEIAMANEAFALSPMSARAAEPNEQDYDAIREAFMETARGRWFLGEYAKRNRNADTRMVLDAVAKIEETLAAQRQPVVEDRLPEALVEIRRAIREAETIAIAAFDPAAIEASLAPIPRGVRIIREISWRWREIGADGRICDLIDLQLASIETACGQISTMDPRVELKAAFDLLRDRVEQLDGGASPQGADPSPVPTPETSSPVAEAQPVETASAEMASEAAARFAEIQPDSVPAVEAETSGAAETLAITEGVTAAAVAPAPDAASEIALDDVALEEEAVAEPVAVAEVTDEFSLDAAAAAEDEAVLEAIALEMAAPDPDFDEIIAPVETAAPAEAMVADVAAPVAAELPEPIAPEPVAAEPVAAAVAEAPVEDAPIAMDSLTRLTDAIAEAAAEVMEQPAQAFAAAQSTTAPAATLPPPSPLSAPLSAPSPEPSLGATILASGIVQKPRAANDPLAPIRRMTQAEKIAFFS